MQSLCCKRLQPLATPRSVLQPLAACYIRNIVCLKVRVSASCVVGCQGWTVAHYCTHRRNTQTCNSTTCIMHCATCNVQHAACNKHHATAACKTCSIHHATCAIQICLVQHPPCAYAVVLEVGPCMRAELKLWCIVYVCIVFLYAVCGMAMLHVAYCMLHVAL